MRAWLLCLAVLCALPVSARPFKDLCAIFEPMAKHFMYRVLAPGAKAGHIAFEPGRAAFAEVRLPQGARRLTADEKGEIRIPFDDAWKATNPVIALSEMPRKISLTFK